MVVEARAWDNNVNKVVINYFVWKFFSEPLLIDLMTVLNNDFFRFRYHKGKINATNKNPTKNDTIRNPHIGPEKILD